MNQNMHSIWHRAFNKCLLLLWLFHMALLFMFLKCPPASQKPTKFLSFFQTDFASHLLREVISVPTPSPLAPRTGAQFSLWGLYWTVDLRVWSSLTGDWHGAGSPAIKAWKSKYGGQSQWILFSWFHQMEGNGLKLMSGQFLQLTVEEFKKLAWKRHVIFYVHIPLRELAS